MGIVIDDMYLRNLQFNEIKENIQKIKEKEIVILGDYPHGIYVALNLLLLGFRRFIVFGSSYGKDRILFTNFKGYFRNFFERLFRRVEYLSGERVFWKFYSLPPDVDFISNTLEDILRRDVILLDTSENENNLSILEKHPEKTVVGISRRDGFVIFRPSQDSSYRRFFKNKLQNSLFSIPLSSMMAQGVLYEVVIRPYCEDYCEDGIKLIEFPPKPYRIEVYESDEPFDISVGIVGVGGGGCFSLLQLLEMHKLGYIRLKRLVIYDPKNVKGNNLNRQILYLSEDSIGKPKAIVAGKKCKLVFNEIDVSAYNREFYFDWDKKKIPEGFGNIDLVIDAADNKKATRAIHEYIIYKNLDGYVVGSLGRISFTDGCVNTYFDGETPCFACMYSIPREVLFTKVSLREEECGSPSDITGAPSIITPNAVAGSLCSILPIFYLLAFLNKAPQEICFNEFGFRGEMEGYLRGPCSSREHYEREVKGDG